MMWELDRKEGWAQKNGCFWTVVLEKTIESPLEYKGIKPVNFKGNQSWTFIERIDAEAETPILCPSDVKSQLTGKDLDARRYWGQEEQGVIEDEVVGWCHSMDMSLRKLQEIVKNKEGGHAAVHGVTNSRTQLSDWETSIPFSTSLYSTSLWQPPVCSLYLWVCFSFVMFFHVFFFFDFTYK